MRINYIIGLSILLIVAAFASEINPSDDDDKNSQKVYLYEVNDQGHENNSPRKVRQFGYGRRHHHHHRHGYGGPEFGGPGFYGPGIGGAGFGGGSAYGGFGGEQVVREEVIERVRIRENVGSFNAYGGGGF